MNVTYDPDGDVLFIQLSVTVPVDSVEFAPGIYLELDEEGSLISVEIIDASKKYKDYNQVKFTHYPRIIHTKSKKKQESTV